MQQVQHADLMGDEETGRRRLIVLMLCSIALEITGPALWEFADVELKLSTSNGVVVFELVRLGLIGCFWTLLWRGKEYARDLGILVSVVFSVLGFGGLVFLLAALFDLVVFSIPDLSFVLGLERHPLPFDYALLAVWISFGVYSVFATYVLCSRHTSSFLKERRDYYGALSIAEPPEENMEPLFFLKARQVGETTKELEELNKKTTDEDNEIGS